MSGTFSSLGGALSALRYSTTALDVAMNNVANARTEGYTRQVVESASIGAPTQVARWSRSDSSVGGVQVTAVTRAHDLLLDARVRHEHDRQEALDVRAGALERVESGFGEPGSLGIATRFADLAAAWQDLADNPGGGAARSEVLARAATLADAVRAQAANLDTEVAGQRTALDAVLSQADAVASELAATNASILAARRSGSETPGLLDRRDHLAVQLAELVGARGEVGPDGRIEVTLGGVPLVTGDVASPLAVTSSAAGTVLTVGGTPLTAAAGGRAGGIVTLLDTDLPALRAGLSETVTAWADEVNGALAAGYDLAGDPGAALIDLDPADPAGSVRVVLTDPDRLAASTAPGGDLGGENALALARLDGGERRYEAFVQDLGTTVAAAGRVAETQRLLTSQVDGAREQLAGVNLDEEMVAMVAAQRTYEAAARLMTTLDSVLDTLINRTGLLR